MATMMEQMEQMMRRMMPGVQPRELYPTMMSLPSLSDAQRAEIQRAAQERMKRGSSMVADAHNRLFWAAGASDARAMSEASALMREGLAIFDSGLAASRAISESQPPRDVALAWFKREMNLVKPAGQEQSHGDSGFSPFHTTSMAALVAFALLAIAFYVRRSRRVAALLQKLAVESVGTAQGAHLPAGAADGSEAHRSSLPAPVSPASSSAQMVPPGGDNGTGQLPQADARAPPPPNPGKIPAWRGMLRVAAVFDETQSVKTFRLVDTDGGSIPFCFIPGQFLWVRVEVAGAALKRSYTISSSPTRRDYVEITVKREDRGIVSRHLHANVIAGGDLEIEVPFGYFTFTGAEADSIVLIGGGVGATPLMSVLRYLTDRCWGGDIFYLFCCRTSAEFLFRDEIEQLQRRHPNLHVVATMTRATGTVWIGPEGRITKDLIDQSVPEIARRRVHLCGPTPMMDEMRSFLIALGVPRTQIKSEAFGTDKRAATARAAAAAPGSPAPVIARPQGDVSPKPIAVPTVSFSRSGRSAALAPDMTVLEAAESVGVAIENSCRSGTCGTCKVRLLGGSVSMEVEDALEPGEKAQGWILACQAKASVDLAVEA